MKLVNNFTVALATVLCVLPADVFARGFGGRGGGGGGARPGGGGSRPSFGGGGSRPNFGGGGSRPNFGGSGGTRPNLGGMTNRSPSFSHPIGGGSSRPNFAGSGTRPQIGSNRPGAGGSGTRNPLIAGGATRPGAGGSGTRNPLIAGGNRPGAGGSGTQNPFLPGMGNRPGAGGSGTRNPIIDGGNRPGAGGNRPHNPIISGGGNRPGGGGSGARNPIIGGGGNRPNFPGGIGNNTNIGNRTHFGDNNFNNIHNNFNNINIATNRPYYNNWQHGNWNGNWSRPGWAGGGTQWGNGYWNGWAHGWAHGYNRGYWNGGWGGYWHGGGGYWGQAWYARPIAWGLGAWALGSIMYGSGYATYANPYFVGGYSGPAYYDYSQPITVIQQPDVYDSTALVAGGPVIDPAVDPGVAAPVPDNPPSPQIQQGTSHMDVARTAFQNGDYATAASEIDLAIQALPNDAALHEFRALVFFATQDYKQAAATLYAVLSAGPGWDWTTMSGMYADNDTYTQQLRALEDYVKANPSAADGRFVLAYHYMTCSYPEAARKQYEQVLKLIPNDQLSAQLLRLVGGDPTQPKTSDDPVPEPPDVDATAENQPTAPVDIDPSKIVGNWTARRPDDTTFRLNLTPDSKFTWTFTQGTKKQEFGGKYSVDQAILVLERSDGAQMPGLVTLSDNGFNFKLYGGAPDDPGLDFAR